jgi:predicted transcriptional regulator YheO
MEPSDELIGRLVDNIGALLGNRCEIVVHDFTQGLDRTIIKIVNGQVSGRSVGGCPSSLFFEMYDKINLEQKDLPVYFNTEQGRLFKSSTTFIHGEGGAIVGAICINFDVTDLLQSQGVIQQFVGYDPDRQPGGQNKEHFLHDVHELMEYCLRSVEVEIGKPGTAMGKEERLRALAFLDKKGVLEISKSSLRLCEFFGISKFTLYAELNKIRGDGIPADAE